jgi:glycosyltransferase involved in cell wall biosynthesis
VRVLVLSQYFPPEIGATQARVGAIAARFVQRGHQVEVICEVPNHPQGIVHNGFKGRLIVRRRIDGYAVTHIWVRTAPKKTVLNRLAFYASYAAGASIVGSVAERPDLVIASSPPLPVAAAGAVVAWRHRVPWIMDVRDLWPEAAVAMGELSHPMTLRLARRLEAGLYRSASAITVVTSPFRRAISRQLAYPPKVALIPNGTTEFWLDGHTIEGDRVALDLPSDAFIWAFAGNLGEAQGLETAIEASAVLGHGCILLIVGDGPARAKLEAHAERLAANVLFRDQVQPSTARSYLRAADALLVSLSADPVFESFIPSKLYDFCAVGRPVIVAAAGEPQRLAARAQACLTVQPGDAPGLARAVGQLRADPELRTVLASRGRDFARANLRDQHLDRFVDIAERLARRK